MQISGGHPRFSPSPPQRRMRAGGEAARRYFRSNPLAPALPMNLIVGQASRLPRSAAPTNRSRWRTRWAGETPALLCRLPGSKVQIATFRGPLESLPAQAGRGSRAVPGCVRRAAGATSRLPRRGRIATLLVVPECAVSSVGRALPRHGRGHKFKSCTAHQPSLGAQRRAKAAAP